LLYNINFMKQVLGHFNEWASGKLIALLERVS